MKRLAVFALALPLLLAGCSAPGEQQQGVTQDGQVYEVKQPLADGREVTCLVYASYYQGGLSCDWEGSR